jgi:D-lactate dehydrogenase (cytochrome)
LDRDDALQRIRARVGPKGWLAEADDIEPYLVERRGLFRGATALVVRPAATAEVADVVRICAEAGLKIVPQGGNTGLCGGGVPDLDGDNIVLSLARMNRVRRIDVDNFTLIAEAGCILADIQNIAAERGLFFPISLGAEGSCQIGGNIATNAGGIQVLRYGNMREQVLGLEAVLPDGRVWEGLRTLPKDNTGYDLKQLFIGSEGTLGIITAAALRLYPALKVRATTLVALRDPRQALRLLTAARSGLADLLTAFELMPRIGVEFALRHVPGLTDPFPNPYPWYVLLEAGSSDADALLAVAMENILSTALGENLILDGVIAANLGQARAFWRIREGLVEGQRFEGGSIKHDISVPVSSVPDFIDRASAAVATLLPGIRPVPFGHLGDGNIHFNLLPPPHMAPAAFLAQAEALMHAVSDVVRTLDGSFSAEHGIGQLKTGLLEEWRGGVEMDLLRAIKRSFDPAGTLNPGKILLF